MTDDIFGTIRSLPSPHAPRDPYKHPSYENKVWLLGELLCYRDFLS